MKWMLLLVLAVIGVGTLMGTTATPVMWDRRCQAWLCQQQAAPNDGSHLPDLFLRYEGGRLYRSGAPGIDEAVRRKRRCSPKAVPRDQVQMHPRARGGVRHTDLNRGTHESLRFQRFLLLTGRNCCYDSRSKSAKPESLSIANIAALRYTSCKVTAGNDLY